MIKLKGGDDKNSILAQTAKRMNMPTLNSKSAAAQNASSAPSQVATQPTPLAQRLGMPSAQPNRSNNGATDWSNKSNRINLGAPLSIRGKSRQTRYDDDEDAAAAEEETAEEKEQIANEKLAAADDDADDDDDDDELFGGDDDRVLQSLRSARLTELKAATGKANEWKALGHGQYAVVSQDDFLSSVTASKYVVCHFFHSNFERCKIVDKHLSALATRHLPTKFICVDAEKAPFFVQKLVIKTLPTVVLFKDGIAIDRVVGFDDLGARDDFDTATMEKRLAKAGVVLAKGDDDALDKKKVIGSIRASAMKAVSNDSDDDDL